MMYRLVAIAVAGFSIATGMWACGSELFPSPLGSADAAPPGDATLAKDSATTAEAGQCGAPLDASLPQYECPPLDSIDGSVAEAFAPSNFHPITIDASAISDIDVTDVDGGCLFDTDALTFSCANQTFVYSASSVAQDCGPPLAVFAMGAFTIEPGVVVDAFGARALVIYAQGAVDIEGELRAAGGPTAFYDASATQYPLPSGSLINGPGSFTNGAGFCGTSAGGPGGPASPDSGVTTYGSATLVPLQGGSSPTFRINPDPGGYAGGAIQLTSTIRITVGSTGLIDVNGSGGIFSGGGMDEFGGGGASGGAILLEAPILTIAGGLAANGGGGAGLSSPDPGGTTSAGVAQAPGCDVTFDGGGAGSYGDDPNGKLGTDCQGGGGAGRIALKARACEITGILSPSSKSGCANAFPLAPP